MPKVNKKLGWAAPSINTNEDMYKVPSGKYAVVKSLTIANNNNTDAQVSVYVGSISFIIGHTLKANSTLLFADLDIPLLPGEIVTIRAAGALCTFVMSGYEDDYISSEYSYLVVAGTPTSDGATQSITRDSDMILRSIIVVNPNSTVSTLGVRAPWSLIQKELSGYDTLLLNKMQYFIEKSTGLNFRHVSGSVGRVAFILEKVVQ